MRISVNLATRPFVELRPLFRRLRLLMLLLSLLCLGAAVAAHLQQRKLDRAEGQLDQLRDRTITTQQQKLHSEARMREPGNAAVLDRAHFLNALFLQKSFSWTAVMMDLENVLPTGVQVTSIEPQVAANGDVVIRLRVAGDRDRAVQLVRNLERSRRFLAPRLSGESAQAREPGARGSGSMESATALTPTGPAGPGSAAALPTGVEFDILADYNPLPVINSGSPALGSPAVGSSTTRPTSPNGGAR